ncbi:hypothetical protein HBB16_04480 [Pseudonocardia sp. MCCB 268]|nr:hypothetical protein [Pseudonocardia cytotoxica]
MRGGCGRVRRLRRARHPPHGAAAVPSAGSVPRARCVMAHIPSVEQVAIAWLKTVPSILVDKVVFVAARDPAVWAADGFVQATGRRHSAWTRPSTGPWCRSTVGEQPGLAEAAVGEGRGSGVGDRGCHLRRAERGAADPGRVPPRPRADGVARSRAGPSPTRPGSRGSRSTSASTGRWLWR